jgi:hypothetical protein
MGETEKKLVTTFGSAVFDPLGTAISNIGSAIAGSKEPSVLDVYSAEDLVKAGIIPGGFMLQPLGETASAPALSTGGIVAENNPEGVGELDSWGFTQQLLAARRVVAERQAIQQVLVSEKESKAIAEQQIQTQTEKQTSGLIAAGLLILLVIL